MSDRSTCSVGGSCRQPEFVVVGEAGSGEEAVCRFDIERGVPEPWGSQYDVRAMLNSMAVLQDGQHLQLDGQKVQVDDQRLQLPDHLIELLLQTDLGELLRQDLVIGELDEGRITIAVSKTPPRHAEVPWGPQCPYRGRVEQVAKSGVLIQVAKSGVLIEDALAPAH
jgi:hypothetical protein